MQSLDLLLQCVDLTNHRTVFSEPGLQLCVGCQSCVLGARRGQLSLGLGQLVLCWLALAVCCGYNLFGCCGHFFDSCCDFFNCCLRFFGCGYSLFGGSSLLGCDFRLNHDILVLGWVFFWIGISSRIFVLCWIFNRVFIPGLGAHHLGNECLELSKLLWGEFHR